MTDTHTCTTCGEPEPYPGECDGCADDRIQAQIEFDDRECSTCDGGGTIKSDAGEAVMCPECKEHAP